MGISVTPQSDVYQCPTPCQQPRRSSAHVQAVQLSRPGLSPLSRISQPVVTDQTYTASMENDSTPQTHPEAHFPDHHIESLHNSSTSHDHHVGHGFQQDDYTHDELSVTPARQPNTAHHEWHPTHHDQSDAGHHPKHSPHRHRHRRPSNPPPYSYPHHDSTLPPPQTIFGDDSPMQSSTYFNSSEEEGSGYKALLFLFLTWVFFIGFVLYLSPWWDRERGWVGPGYGRDHYP